MVTDGQRFASLSRVERTLSGPQLAQRFGETFREHRERCPEAPPLASPAGREVAPPPGRSLEERAEALVEHVSATRRLPRHRDRTDQPEAARLILAYRNADVERLNEAVRAARQAAGELGAGVTLQRTEYAAGDRIVFLKNDHAGREVRNLDPGAAAVGVKNGTLGTIEQATERRRV